MSCGCSWFTSYNPLIPAHPLDVAIIPVLSRSGKEQVHAMTVSTKDQKEFPVLRNLQYSPLKQGDEQYVVLWDPSGLSSEKLVIPLNYFYLFQFFDGEHSLEQVGAEYLKKYGEFLMPDRLVRLVSDLDDKLFLEGERCDQAKAEATAAYRSHPVRPSAFAGRSYEGRG